MFKNAYYEDTTKLRIYYQEIEGLDEQDWKDLVYDCFRLNMTLDCFYSIDVREDRKNDVYIELFIKDGKYEEVEYILEAYEINDFYLNSEYVAIFDRAESGCNCIVLGD